MKKIIINEILKLRSVRSPWLIVLASQIVLLIGISGPMIRLADEQPAALAVKAIGHVGLMSIFSLVLGIMAVAGEYRHKTITDTFLSVPRRARVIAAKLGVYFTVGIFVGVLSAATALATTAAWLFFKGSSLDLADSQMWSILLGGIGWNAAFAAIGVGLGALIRNLTGAIVAALAWLALVEGVVAQLMGDAGGWLPFRSGSALADLPAVSGSAGISQWQGGLALAGYACLFMVLALTIAVKRDVA